jgi:Family of unknown function (DUF6804)
MLTKIMKLLLIAALLLAAFWRSSANFQLVLESVVCVTGLLVVMQAVRKGKYFWAAGFLAVAALFNPVVPVAFSRNAFLWLDAMCIVTFLVSLVVLKRQPRLSMPLITNVTPGSESL